MKTLSISNNRFVIQQQHHLNLKFVWMQCYIWGTQCKYLINKAVMLRRINNTNIMQLLTLPLRAFGACDT